MKHRLTLVSLALAAGFAANPAHAQSGVEFKFSGFGTLGVVHSDDSNADYVGSRFQPNGAGRTRSTAFGPDSKLGGQLSAKFNADLSAVVQVVSQHQYDNSYKPMLEWANVKYQINDQLSVRAGRIALPTYLLSESRFVGYASPWTHPPTEVYSVLAVTNNDGVDMSWRRAFGDVNNTFQVFYGQGSAKLPSGKVKAKTNWGFNNSVEIGSLTLRAGYNSIDLDLQISSLNGLFGGLNQFAAGAAAVQSPAFQSSATQARDLVEKYRLDKTKISAVVLGLNYDPGNWFVMSEYVAFKGDSFLSDSTSWYATGGWRIGSLTPYATYASTQAHIDTETGITAAVGTPLAAGAAGLNGGVNATLRSFNGSQDSVSVGLRWDAMRNLAIKGQVEQVNVKDDSNGRFTNVQAGTKVSRKVNLFSLVADFVF